MENNLENMRQEYERGFYEGMFEGLRRHTWMKDGVSYVGNGMYTLEHAEKLIDMDIKKGEYPGLKSIKVKIK